jgi:2-polyprenyl-3-methyl-5-hydroxy-6-metoxy-1,4-benzoquinol methylase
MKCYLCGNSNFTIRNVSVRDNPAVKVIECVKCSLVTLDSIAHIPERHYEEGGMHSEGASLLSWIQETEIDDQRRLDFLKEKIIGKNILDFGCGNGGFLNKTKPYTARSEGIELEERVQKYFREIDLKVWSSLSNAVDNNNGNYDLITAFHVFEHLSDPLGMLVELSKLLTEKGEIIIEVPSSEDALLTLYQSTEFSNFTYWSQHLFLFNSRTIEDLIRKSGLKLNWVKQVQRYSLSNHLYWLSKGEPGGHKIWTFLNDEQLDKAYGQHLASVGKCDTIMASISL